MRFLLLVRSPRSRWDDLPETGTDDEMDAHTALINDLDARGWLVDCSPVRPPQDAVRVRVRDGETLRDRDTVDEDTDVVAGYYLIDCPSAQDAVAVAARVPDAATGEIIVHPLLNLTEVPTGSRPQAGD